MYLRTAVFLQELPMVKGSSILKYNTSFSLLNEDGENGKVKFQTTLNLCSMYYSIFKHNSSSSLRALKAIDEFLLNAVSPQIGVSPSPASGAVMKNNEIIMVFALNSILPHRFVLF